MGGLARGMRTARWTQSGLVGAREDTIGVVGASREMTGLDASRKAGSVAHVGSSDDTTGLDASRVDVTGVVDSSRTCGGFDLTTTWATESDGEKMLSTMLRIPLHVLARTSATPPIASEMAAVAEKDLDTLSDADAPSETLRV
jgi:hypothetical protein